MTEASALYRRTLAIDMDFPEAIAGLAITLSSVCDWRGRGGLPNDLYIDEMGRLDLTTLPENADKDYPPGWMDRLKKLCTEQVRDVHTHAVGVIAGSASLDHWLIRPRKRKGRQSNTL